MTTGVVLDVDVERYGDTLTAATAATDVVLAVDSVIDFADEDDFAAGPQWLKIGDSAAMQYVSVDDDANTITLATAVGAVYEAGEPVRMWDPNIYPSGGEVVSYKCWVELDEADENDQPIPAEIEHDKAIFFGINQMAEMIGARVAIEPDGDDPDVWHVAEVIGQAPTLDPDVVTTPALMLTLPSTTLVPFDVDTPVIGLVALNGDESPRFPARIAPTTAWLTLPSAGLYQIVATAAWDSNPVGYRHVLLEQQDAAGTTTLLRRIQTVAVNGAQTTVQAAVLRPFVEGTKVRMLVRQNSTNGGFSASLNLLGLADGTRTTLEIVRVTN